MFLGCASGFGNDLAKRLDSKGFQVFASCRNAVGKGVNDLKENCSDRLKVFCLDVSNDESVATAVDFVQQNLGSNGNHVFMSFLCKKNANTALKSLIPLSPVFEKGI